MFQPLGSSDRLDPLAWISEGLEQVHLHNLTGEVLEDATQRDQPTQPHLPNGSRVLVLLGEADSSQLDA